ncbi:MAG: di-heme oxidoredictase family protein [Planctomycetota bacterium]
MNHSRSKAVVPLLGLSFALGLTGVASAQYAERAQLMGSGQPDCDCSGRSIKNPRVRAIHTTDSNLRGGTAWFLERDPFLAYQLGRNLNFREFRERDGVFDPKVSNLGGPMPDGTTAKITANNQVSCSGCHNLPQGNPGGGPNFSKDSGTGRNSPHYYGAGIMEMLAIQTREKMLNRLDTNRDGWISIAESQAAGTSLFVETAPGGRQVNYGNPRLTNGATGKAQLNNIFRVWYVDAQGRPVAGATSVNGNTTVGYNFEMIVWGAGQGPGRSALNPTNRAFLWDPWKAHGGLESYDPSTTNDPDGNGVSEPTLAGAIQFPVTHKPADRGNSLDPLGFSRDDPDHDGYLNEISEGDLDLGEWFMLNAPRPAFAGTNREYQAGIDILQAMRCTDCHVPDWKIESKVTTGNGPHYAGDRRFIDLDVRFDTKSRKLVGRLVPLYTLQGDRYVRNLGSFNVSGLFTDLAQHDMGAGFEEIDFGGTRNRIWRTSPLWGVGSGFPWGHDGQSLTLENAILRHDGEGAASKALYLRASSKTRAQLIDFLTKLQLFDIESLPTDMDGDGRISTAFQVAGQDTGIERFNPEWLFRVPLRIQGFTTNIDGLQIRSFAGQNVTAAYGMNLPLRIDTDLDGWADAWDNAPAVRGFKDGVNN